MRKTNQATASKRNLIWTALLVILAMLLVLGVSFARYQTKNEYPLSLEYEAKAGQIYLLDATLDESGNLPTDENGNYNKVGNWTLEETVDGASVRTLQFLLANSENATTVCESEQEAELLLFGSVGMGAIEQPTITLTVDGDSYTATATEVPVDSVLYTAYGPGYKYEFLNSAGQKLTWKLEGGKFTSKSMTLTVAGNVSETAVLYLFTPYVVGQEEAWAGQLEKTDTSGGITGSGEGMIEEEGETLSLGDSGTATQDKNTAVRPSGTLTYCPPQYSRELSIIVTSGEEGAVVFLGDGYFPALTTYTIDGVATTLSEEGPIILQSGETAQIDLSQTAISGTIVFNTSNGTYSLDEVTIPTIQSVGTPLIVENELLTLPISYQWGVLVPTITVKELTKDENGALNFMGNNLFSWKEDSNGNIELTSLGADAGTYLVTIDWNDDDITLYSLETTVFLQHDLLD